MQSFFRFFFLVLLIFNFNGVIIADAGPKPSMKFSFVYKTTHPVKVLEGWQLESRFKTFNVYDTLLRLGPQRFNVSQDKASSVSYGYEDYHKIVIQFDDRKRESNVFPDESFNSVYEVSVLDDRLIVKDITPFTKDSSTWAVFLKALLLTLALELMVAFVYLKLAKKPSYILLFVILGNLITLPLVWFVFPIFLNVGGAMIVGEIFAFVSEALFLLLTCRKWFKPSGAFLLSFMMNVMSLLIGGLALVLMIGF
jgi:hypothetical protein